MENDLKTRFHAAMLELYKREKEECHRNAPRFFEMVNGQGGYNAAVSLLRTKEYPKGLTDLWKLGRLDISVEALVLKDEWSALFLEEDKATARKRLKELGYFGDSDDGKSRETSDN
jgi:hypothetical protein